MFCTAYFKRIKSYSESFSIGPGLPDEDDIHFLSATQDDD
jgi:hypothetical protein